MGDTTIAKILAYAGDVRRFTHAKAFAAFMGVTPRLYNPVRHLKETHYERTYSRNRSRHGNSG